MELNKFPIFHSNAPNYKRTVVSQQQARRGESKRALLIHSKYLPKKIISYSVNFYVPFNCYVVE